MTKANKTYNYYVIGYYNGLKSAFAGLNISIYYKICKLATVTYFTQSNLNFTVGSASPSTA